MNLLAVGDWSPCGLCSYPECVPSTFLGCGCVAGFPGNVALIYGSLVNNNKHAEFLNIFDFSTTLHGEAGFKRHWWKSVSCLVGYFSFASPLGPMTFPATGFCHGLCGCPLVEWALTLIKRLLVSPMISKPLLYKQAHPDWCVDILVHGSIAKQECWFSTIACMPHLSTVTARRSVGVSVSVPLVSCCLVVQISPCIDFYSGLCHLHLAYSQLQ